MRKVIRRGTGREEGVRFAVETNVLCVFDELRDRRAARHAHERARAIAEAHARGLLRGDGVHAELAEKGNL